MPLGVEVLIDKKTLRRIELSSLDYYTHHISPHTIPPKMTKLSSKLTLTKLFYISQQQNLYPPSKMTKLFPNSPGNCHNHRPNQNIPNISYSQLVTQAYQGWHLWANFLPEKF